MCGRSPDAREAKRRQVRQKKEARKQAGTPGSGPCFLLVLLFGLGCAHFYVRCPSCSPPGLARVDLFSGESAYILPTNEKWLLALLNSNVANWIYGKISNTIRGSYLRFIRQYIEAIPIPSTSRTDQAALEALVDRILAAKQADPQADVTDLEREIDERIYHLYGLTPEEIRIVEESLK